MLDDLIPLDPDTLRVLREAEGAWADPTRRAFPHRQVAGAYWCPVDQARYYGVLLVETGEYRCQGCGAVVDVPTCGGEGE